MADAASHSFSIDGFLSSQNVVAAASNQPDATRQAAVLCIDLNRLSLRRLQEVILNDDNIVSALLVAQATTSFESAVLLASMGMEGEARALVRRCIESAILCYALVKCPELNVLDRFKADRYKHYKTLANELPRSLELSDDHVLKVYLKRISENLEEVPGKLDLSHLAEKAGIKDVYDSIFRFLSADASHPTLDSLQKVAAYDSENKSIVGILIRPRHDGMGTTLLIAAISQLVALRALQIIHPDPDIEEMVSAYTGITRNIWKMMFPEWTNAMVATR